MAQASTLTITKTGDTSDGVCDADCSIREATSVAVPGDTVSINPPPPGIEPLPRMPSFQQQLDILCGDAPAELAHSAIEQLPGMLLGTPVVLPTSGGQVSMETVRFFDRASVDLEDAINALTGVKMDNATDAGVRAHANQVSVLLEATLSVIRGLNTKLRVSIPRGPYLPT